MKNANEPAKSVSVSIFYCTFVNALIMRKGRFFSRFVKMATPKVWTKDKRLAEMLKYVHNHIYEDVNIDSLASIACVTKSHFIRLFVKTFGMPPLQYK